MKGSTGEWYYGNSDGSAVLGWVRSGGKDYYMDPGQGGRMATGGDSWSWYQDGRRIDTTGAAGSKTCKWQRGKRNTWWYGNDDMYATGTRAPAALRMTCLADTTVSIIKDMV